MSTDVRPVMPGTRTCSLCLPPALCPVGLPRPAQVVAVGGSARSPGAAPPVWERVLPDAAGGRGQALLPTCKERFLAQDKGVLQLVFGVASV